MAANVRKRVNSDGPENFLCEPLDVMAIQVVGRDGEKKVVPALNVGFMEPRQYVMYKALPYLFLPSQKSVNTARVEEWLERTSYFEEDLVWLLRLPHNRFWSQVVYDEDLHLCLQSYLSNAPRDYDLNPDAPKDVLSRELTLHKLVFLAFLRMSTYKESKMHHISPKIFSEIIYDNFVFDIPRIMDLSVLYWFRNQAIISRMMDNLFSLQPSYVSDLEEAIPCVLMAFDSVEERLGLREKESNGPIRLEDFDSGTFCSFHDIEILDIINYITDVSATLFTFTEAYPGAGPLFFQSQAALRIPSFYDLVFPLLEKEIDRRKSLSKEENDLLDTMSTKISLSKSFLIRCFRSLIATACIQPLVEAKCDELLESDNVESFHLDYFLQTFMEVCTEKLFLCHYNYIFPIQNDLDTFSDAGIPLDPASVQYILSCVEPVDVHNKKKAKDQHRANGPVLVGVLQPAPNQTEVKKKVSTSVAEGPSTNYSYPEGATASAKPGEAELQSLIFLVKEIIPDLGDGFVEACLEYYNYASEKVIDALLCNSLPPNLDRMDRNLERRKPAEQNEPPSAPSILSERKSIFDYDEFDVFNREDVPMDRIHMGKSKKTPTAYDMLTSEGTSQVLKDLILQYEARQEEEEEQRLENLYEDEYDDTYDSHGINIIEPQPENELLRPFTVPITLRPMMKKGAQQVPDEEEESDEENSRNEGNENDGVQTGEKSEPPRDSFCENPEVVRQRREHIYQTKMRNRGKEPASSGQPNLQKKERHKGQVANHNRRKQGDFKRSRGMGPFPSR